MNKPKDKNKADAFIKNFLGFPLKVPIAFKNVKIGEIKIDYDRAKTSKLPKKKAEEKEDYNNVVLTELIKLPERLEKDIDLALKFREHTQERMRRFLMMVRFFYFPHHMTHYEYLFYEIYDDEIFNFIRKEGLSSLRISLLDWFFRRWLSHEEIAGKKINKLKNSLMECYLGGSYEDAHLQIGRPEISAIKGLGDRFIRNMYQEITSILKFVKIIQKNYQSAEIRDVIDKAIEEYIFSLQDTLEKKSDSEELKEKIEKLLMEYVIHKDTKFPNPITECLENDQYLSSEFLSYRWEPNKFAKKIVANLIESSVSKIEKILYSKNKS